MVHGDDNGLVLPPRVAPVQVMIIPIAAHKLGVIEAAETLRTELSQSYRVKIDSSDKMPGWKFSEYEMKGVPLRLELGPRDLEKNQCLAVRRDTGEKIALSLDTLTQSVSALLDDIHENLLNKAQERMDSRISSAADWDSFVRLVAEKPGFIRALWCGDPACEQTVKDETGATSRCIPFDQQPAEGLCICCQKKAKHMVIWGKAY